MTKLEELKAALESATPGEWKLITAGTRISGFKHPFDFVQVAPMRFITCEGLSREEANTNAQFTTLAHNLMPALLEAVDLLETLRYSMSQYDDGEWFLHEGSDELIAKVDDFMEKLK